MSRLSHAHDAEPARPPYTLQTRQNQGILSAVNSWLRPSSTRSSGAEYEPLYEEPTPLEDDVHGDRSDGGAPFSWLEYWLFVVIGMAMLWPWNMFLASAPYFQGRFAGSPWILQNFQSAILTVSTLSNLTSMYILTNIQQTASYPFRMKLAFVIETIVFIVLGLSTMFFVDASPVSYLVFTLLMVTVTALATGLIQNGAFSFCASFGCAEYTQGLMAGQGIAGVLPSIAQVLVSLAAADNGGDSNSNSNSSNPIPSDGGMRSSTHAQLTSAFLPFLAAVVVCIGALVSLAPLIRRHDRIIENRMVDRMADSVHSIEEAERVSRKVISIKGLLVKLFWPAASIFMCFTVAMFFPVFTSKILSVHTASDSSTSQSHSLFAPAAFIPLAFFFWNLGDLGGRVLTIIPLKVQHQPKVLFTISLLRFGFLPMYKLCNIGGRGAIISSDLFYLTLVQFPFGLTTGWLASSCMMASADWVEEGEREAAGGFMGLCLVAGLAAGSVLSFTASSA
ncbi:Equilibrative nucleoside transporter 1 [Ceratocystis fimbriata CBS 114723]|uniref:Equilibrative nucleoside transporter 1 n=1 Tax=Ceratocystis fimbriata CBS 114723 TaxID=1035309 RepID=A0A2C5X9P1_9PEZI|nr:Equilibrative nucleoside transporter 1 [Ceratocystis fimbriata CBS 114723]